MCRLNITNPLRSRVFGHVDADDYKIRRTIEVRIVRSADADIISRLPQPFLQQSTREEIFLVDHDVQSVPFLHLRTWRLASRRRIGGVSTDRRDTAIGAVRGNVSGLQARYR